VQSLADADADGDLDTAASKYADGHGYPRAYTDPDENDDADQYAGSHEYTDGNGYSDADCHADTHPNADAHRNGHAATDYHPHPYTYAGRGYNDTGTVQLVVPMAALVVGASAPGLARPVSDEDVPRRIR